MKFQLNPGTLEQYRSMLPHGSKNVVAARAGVTTQSISMFLRGDMYSKRIEDAILGYVAELNKDRQAKLRKAGLL